MELIIKELPEMKMACFEGYAPDPETKAHNKMEEWLKKNKLENIKHRVFGHNVDMQGNLSHDPHNVGYKFLVTIDDEIYINPDVKTEVIKPGKFAVIGVEGSIDAEPIWIGEGWLSLKRMMKEKKYYHKCPRDFEEELEPSKPRDLRLDLYLEIE